MKNRVTGTLVWLVVCSIFIYLVDLFTFNPTVISGNGNLGLLFVFPAVVAFFLFAKGLWKALGRLELKSTTWIKIRLGGLALLVVFGLLEYYFTMNLIRDLGGFPGNESSRIYRYSWLNQYTNTIFINIYTLGIVVAGVTFIKTIAKTKSTYSSKTD